jgi:FkbH-like protein
MKELEYPFDSEYILRKKKSLKKELLQNQIFIEKKVAILCGSTVGEMQNILELFLLNHGIKPIFWQGQYNRYYEEAMFNNYELKEFKPDIIYIHTTNKNIIDFPTPEDTSEVVSQKLSSTFSYFSQMWDKLRDELQCPIIQNNFEPLPYRLMGNADVYQESGELNFINLLNQEMYGYAREHKNFYVNDLNYQASWFGLERWFDNSMWYMYKYPFAVDAIPLVSHNLANIIKSLFGKNKKALALDLDNTLWGGVIGDDGIEGIKLGIDTAEGMAYDDMQNYIKKLSRFGITLNVCSKNEESNAKLGFNHPSSKLKIDDFIVFKANWNNKDLNIKEIASESNILEESIVFIDDNPVERELIKNIMPHISIPELTSAENFVKILDQSGFFEVTILSADDRKRNTYYKANKAREERINQFGDYSKYLKSLEMTCKIDNFNSSNIERVVQLINKTNQFNLTTARYTAEEVEQYMKGNSVVTISANLKDKFGENGIVSCMMASKVEDTMQIDLWVMSCRVFKRDLEKAIFDELVKQCKQKGIKKIRGSYYKTKKNQFVENLYPSLGFQVIEKDDEHGIWQYEIPEEYTMMNEVMEVVYDDKK